MWIWNWLFGGRARKLHFSLRIIQRLTWVMNLVLTNTSQSLCLLWRRGFWTKRRFFQLSTSRHESQAIGRAISPVQQLQGSLVVQVLSCFWDLFHESPPSGVSSLSRHVLLSRLLCCHKVSVPLVFWYGFPNLYTLNRRHLLTSS